MEMDDDAKQGNLLNCTVTEHVAYCIFNSFHGLPGVETWHDFIASRPTSRWTIKWEAGDE